MCLLSSKLYNLIVLSTLALAPCLTQQVAAASEDDVVLQQDTEGDERRQFWISIATNPLRFSASVLLR